MSSEYWNGQVEFDHSEAQEKMGAYRKEQQRRQQKREEEARELAAALEQELALEEARSRERKAVRTPLLAPYTGGAGGLVDVSGCLARAHPGGE